jgi:hypothetical protein
MRSNDEIPSSPHATASPPMMRDRERSLVSASTKRGKRSVRSLPGRLRNNHRGAAGVERQVGPVGCSRPASMPRLAVVGVVVSAETCDASRPAPTARVAGRQEPSCSASTPLSTQLPAQPKLRPVLHDAQSCTQVPSLLSSTAEDLASLTPINFFTTIISKHSDKLRLDCVETRSGKEQKLDGFLAHGVALRARCAPCSPGRSIAGHCSGVGGARHPRGARRQVACGAGGALIGSCRHPFRRKRTRRRKRRRVVRRKRT